MTPDAYVAAADFTLRRLADPALAPGMRAYMLDQFDFLGVRAPERRKAIQSALPGRWTAASEVLYIAEQLWNKPEREFRYTAIDLLRRHSKVLGPEHLPQLLSLLQRDAWWDTVDGMTAVIGQVLLAQVRAGKREVQEVCDTWLVHTDHWVRRCAMLHQLGWRLDTDTHRLAHYAEVLAPEKEFFIRKAIGWALRDYARWNPEFVQDVIEGKRTILSPLTIREAGKHL